MTLKMQFLKIFMKKYDDVHIYLRNVVKGCLCNLVFGFEEALTSSKFKKINWILKVMCR